METAPCITGCLGLEGEGRLEVGSSSQRAILEYRCFEMFPPVFYLEELLVELRCAVSKNVTIGVERSVHVQ